MTIVHCLDYDKNYIWPLLYKEEIRLIESKIATHKGPLHLINLASEAIIFKVKSYLKTNHSVFSNPPHIVFLIGPGNNANDALACLFKFNFDKYKCSLIIPELEQKWIDSEKINLRKLSFDTDKQNLENLQILSSKGIVNEMRMLAINYALDKNCKITTKLNKELIREADIIIDALFGIGLNRPLSQTYLKLIKLVNKKKEKKSVVLSIDVPSGLNSDTGRPFLADCAIVADETLTFIAFKPGLLTGVGKDYVGQLSLAPLNLNEGLAIKKTRHILQKSSSLSSTKIFTNSILLFKDCIPPRAPSFHKGQSGTTCIIGGNDEMTGALVLSGRAALYTGSGKTHLLTIAKDYSSFDPCHPELMFHTARLRSHHISEKIASIRPTSIAIGPGLGVDYYSTQALEAVLKEVIEKNTPTVFDADALNILAMYKELYQEQFKKIFSFKDSPITIFTPHPGEAAKLLSTSVQDVENNRINAANKLANDWSSIIILKGSGSIVACPYKTNNNFFINPTGNCGLASGGSGDLLTGIIASLLAQKVDSKYAALASCYWHGLAAEIISNAGQGPIGLTANELINELRKLRNLH